ncbi:MAG: ferrous iron transport protein B [Eubacteriales bacterium]|nr:ferrous iron transport protein B [Eubacteriales bacterium]
MKTTIALAGNPNSGKTTLFNELTGSRQYVGNWPGVTIEKKEGNLKGHKDVVIQDLPGTYSLSPYTLEESIARSYLVKEKPDVIINIIDGTNIERNLFLSTQLLELQIPIVIAVNMMDVVKKCGDKVDIDKLSSTFGCPVIPISALKGENVDTLVQTAMQLAVKEITGRRFSIFSGSVGYAINSIEEALSHSTDGENLKWYAVKLFERDPEIAEELNLSSELKDQIEGQIVACESELDDEAESIITNQRYTYISGIIRSAVQRKDGGGIKISSSDRIDKVLTNRWLALPIFGAVMWLVYWVSMGAVGGTLSEWVNGTFVEGWLQGGLGNWLESVNAAPWLSGLIVDGIVGGVGAVLGFLPLVVVLMFFLAILEDVGYMSRVAFIMDRIFRKFGLSGKSFIPMLIGSGCSIPGIMASRTIEQERDRRMTIITTSFIPCGAKLPIIALLAGALFSGSGWVAVSAYFIGVSAVVLTGIILKKTKMFAGKPAPFVMELPAYHIPGVKNVMRATWERGSSFVKRAGTVILVSSIVLWFLQGFGMVDGTIQMVEDNNTSLLAGIGRVISPIFAPLGFGTWQATVGTFTGLIAKENVVATFGVLYGFSEVAEDGMEYWTAFANDFTVLSAYSFLIFNLICAPCFAAIGAIRREMSSAKWTWFAVGYQTLFAYTLSMIVYQLGMLFGYGQFGFWTIAAILLLGGLIYLLFRKNRYDENCLGRLELAATQSRV